MKQMSQSLLRLLMYTDNFWEAEQCKGVCVLICKHLHLYCADQKEGHVESKHLSLQGILCGWPIIALAIFSYALRPIFKDDWDAREIEHLSVWSR